MASNPMQRKARNSFLLGMLVTLLISLLIIGFLVMQLVNLKKAEQERIAASKKVYALNTDISSGQPITEDNLQLVEVLSTAIPTDAITPSQIDETTVAKIPLTAGTILASEMIQSSEDKTTDDLRLQEYNMIILPSYIEVDDYIDIRLTLPSGQDYIVIPKKRVIRTSETSPTTVWLEMTEEEILTMSNAIVEAYVMTGSNLYATTYVEPGMQAEATPTYPVSAQVLNLIAQNPNITNEAKLALQSRYNQVQRLESLEPSVNQYAEERLDNIETKVEEQITKQKEERQRYLDMLNGEI